MTKPRHIGAQELDLAKTTQPLSPGPLSVSGLCVLAAAVSEHVFAAGATGPPGLLEASIALLGLLGIVPGVLLGFAIRARRRWSPLKTFLFTLPALLYIPFAFSCYFLPSDGGVAKFAGTVGACLAVGTLFVYRPSNRFVHAGFVTLFCAVTVCLLWIPTEFWKGDTISFERVVIVDNLVDKDVVATRPIEKPKRKEKNWLELADGRRLVQTQYEVQRYKNKREVPVWHGAYVALEAAPSEDGREWYKITHYKKKYIPEASAAPPKFLWALSTRRIEMYEEVTRKTYGYVRR